MSIIFTIAPIMLTAAARGYDDTGIFRSERSTLELSGLSRWLTTCAAPRVPADPVPRALASTSLPTPQPLILSCGGDGAARRRTS